MAEWTAERQAVAMRPVTMSDDTFETMLVNGGIVQEDAFNDPDGYDGGARRNAVDKCLRKINDFIAAARADLPDAIAEIRRLQTSIIALGERAVDEADELRAEIDRLTAALKEIRTAPSLGAVDKIVRETLGVSGG